MLFALRRMFMEATPVIVAVETSLFRCLRMARFYGNASCVQGSNHVIIAQSPRITTLKGARVCNFIVYCFTTKMCWRDRLLKRNGAIGNICDYLFEEFWEHTDVMYVSKWGESLVIECFTYKNKNSILKNVL